MKRMLFSLLVLPGLAVLWVKCVGEQLPNSLSTGHLRDAALAQPHSSDDCATHLRSSIPRQISCSSTSAVVDSASNYCSVVIASEHSFTVSSASEHMWPTFSTASSGFICYNRKHPCLPDDIYCNLFSTALT